MRESADPTGRFKHETLALLAGLVDVTAAVFYSVDRDLNAVDHAFHRIGTERLPAYQEHFHALDPLHPRRYARSLHTVLTIEEAVPRRALERSPYYREFMCSIDAHREVELYLRGVDRRLGVVARTVDGLTPREADVVRLVCRGASNREIADTLGIALQTVKTHLEHVYRKLGVRTRTQLIAEIAAVPVPL